MKVVDIRDMVDTKTCNNANSQLIGPLCAELYHNLIDANNKTSNGRINIHSLEDIQNVKWEQLADSIMHTDKWKNTWSSYIASSYTDEEIKQSLCGLFESHIIYRYIKNIEGIDVEKNIDQYASFIQKMNMTTQYEGYGIYSGYHFNKGGAAYYSPDTNTVRFIGNGKTIKPKLTAVKSTRTMHHAAIVHAVPASITGMTSISGEIVNEETSSLALSTFSTDSLTTIEDFSPLMLNFLSQNDKRIMTLPTSTGSGKSYSFGKLAESIGRCTEFNDGTYKAIVYLTDRKKNVADACDDLLKILYSSNPLLCSKVIRLESIPDALLKAFKNNWFDELGDNITNELKSFKTLETWAEECYLVDKELEEETDKKRMSRLKAIKARNIECFNSAYKHYTRDIHKVINDDYRKSKSIIPTIYEYIVHKHEYSALLKIFPWISINHAKYIFATYDKAMFPIDTIFEGKVFLMSDGDGMIHFWDEADTAKSAIAKRLIKQSAMSGVDILDVVKSIGNFKRFIDNSPVMIPENRKSEYQKQAIDIEQKFLALRSKYHIDARVTLPSQDGNFLFIAKTNEVFSYEQNQFYFVENDQGEFEIVPIDDDDDTMDKSLCQTDFVKELDILAKDFMGLIKRVANEFVKDDKMETHYHEINNILHKCMGSGYDDNRLENLSVDIAQHSPKKDENLTEAEKQDYYRNPGQYTRVHQSVNNEHGIECESYRLYTTPENIASGLAVSGAHIIMSSATINNKSIYRNFDFEWYGLSKHLYGMSKHDLQLMTDYLNKRDAYGNQVKYLKYAIVDKVSNKANEIIELLHKHSALSLDTCREMIDEFIKTFRFDNFDDGNDYQLKQVLNLVWSMLKFYENNVHFGLAFCMRKIEDYSVNKLFKDIQNAINIHSKHKLHFEMASAVNIQPKLELINNRISNTCTNVLLTTYETAEKGINPCYKWNRIYGTDDLVAINDSGVKELLDITRDIIVDVDGLYLGALTYVLSPMSDDDESNQMRKDVIYILSATSILESMKIRHEITDDEYTKYMNYVMSHHRNLYQKQNDIFATGFDAKPAFYSKLISDLIQACGRSTRRNVRFKKMTLIVDSKLCEKVQKSNLPMEIVCDGMIDSFTYGMKEMISFLFDESNAVTIPSKSHKSVQGTTKKSAEAIYQDLSTVHSNTATYKKHRSAIKKLYVSQSEFDTLPADIQTHYMKVPGKYRDGYSYKNKLQVNKLVDYTKKIYPVHEGRFKVCSDNLGLPDFNTEIIDDLIKADYNWQCPDGDFYVLTPAAFSILHGNIGEHIMKSFFKSMYSSVSLSDLDDKVYEVCDFVDVRYLKYGLLIAFDAKNYNQVSVNYDNASEKIPYFENKLAKLKEYYGASKVIGFVVNTSEYGDYCKLTQHYTEDTGIELYTVPYIYNNKGEFDSDVCNAIESIIER